MPLADAVFTLKEEIELALNDAGQSIDNGAEDGKTPDQINKKLAFDLAQVIHDDSILYDGAIKKLVKIRK